MSNPHIKIVTIEVECPECKAEGYEFELSCDDVTGGTYHSVACDECAAEIEVHAEVQLVAQL